VNLRGPPAPEREDGGDDASLGPDAGAPSPREPYAARHAERGT